MPGTPHPLLSCGEIRTVFRLLGGADRKLDRGAAGLEVRMYSREKVELFLLATEDGMGPTAAAEFAGVTVSAAKKWATGTSRAATPAGL